MRFSTFATVAALATAVVAAPTNVERHVLHQKRDTTSKTWIKRDRVHSEVKLPMRIGLVQPNMEAGHDLLMDISDPDSPNFAKHLTAEEVIEFFAPPQERVDAVHNWLVKAGVAADRISQSANKKWMELDLSTWEAEALLGTKYHFYEHGPTGKTTIGCDQYHVHEAVREHIDYIKPGITLLATNKARKSDIEKRSFGWGKQGTQPPLLKEIPAAIAALLALLDPNALGLDTCDTAITPACIRSMYNFTQATSAVAGNELGIFEDLGDVYAQEDLNMFFLTLESRIPQGTAPTLEGVDGGTAPNSVLNAGPESDLDFQISYPVIYPQKSILFQTDDPVYEANYTFSGFLNTFLDAIDGSYCNNGGRSNLDPQYPHNVAGGYNKPLQCGVYKPTNVVSVSYGGQEFDLDFNYQKTQCNEFMKLGLQGVSFLISSGDSGVAGPAGDDNSNGCLNGTLGTGSVFSPDFPVTCPYVTAVGATLLTGSSTADAETAVTRFGSGGGFSNIYAIPDYQKSAVNTYLTAHTPAYPSYGATGPRNGRFNSTGRAYPDVSAVGDNVVIYNMGAPTLIGGTSASAPVFAGLITRINDERLKAGKKPVGFLNPTLYKNPSALHDITVGNNPGCGTNGFSVAPGWDPVTGLGTPNYPALLKVFMALP